MSSMSCEFAEVCSLSGNNIKFISGEGNNNADVMFVGRDPGNDENVQGRPFVGLAGNKLRMEIQHVFGSEDKVWITNLVKCHTPNNRGPTIDEITICRVYLHREIMKIKPKVIVALGKDVSYYLLTKGYYSHYPNKPMSELSGNVYTIPLIYKDYNDMISILPCYHPSPRNLKYYSEISATILRAKELVDKLSEVQPSNKV